MIHKLQKYIHIHNKQLTYAHVVIERLKQANRIVAEVSDVAAKRWNGSCPAMKQYFILVKRKELLNPNADNIHVNTQKNVPIDTTL